MSIQQLVSSRLMKAKAARFSAESMWQECRDYYEGRHRTALEIAESCKQDGIPWITAMSPDPYIHVESQVCSDVPDFSFRGRQSCDNQNADTREAMVRFVLENNNFSDLLPAADRQCIIGGTSVWKVFWDGSDVRIASINPSCIFPDPAAKSIQDCEFVLYCYPIQRSKFARLFQDALSSVDLDPLTMPRDPFAAFPEYDLDDDTVIVTEHWFRNDDGQLSFSVFAGGQRLSHTDHYWENTNFTEFPFVFQYRISSQDSIWGHGDLEPILTLVDAVDRELSTAQLSSAFGGNDVILAEHDAFSVMPSNRPGAIWELKPGAMGKVARLGGRSDGEQRIEMLDKLRALIQETVGNFDVDMGREPSKITSATGLAQLIERSELRKITKKAERLGAFRRLLALIDQTALEFYDKKRELYIGAGTPHPQSVPFDPSLLRGRDGYYPQLDTIIRTADPLHSSRAFLLSSIDTLLGHQIDAVNYPLVSEILNLLELGNADLLNSHFQSALQKEVNTHA